MNNPIILMLCLISTVGRFAIDSYLPSFPAIEKAFSITEAQTEWTLTFYLLGFGLSQFFYGPLSDRFGRKKILLSSFVIFIIGNIFCAFSGNITQLLTNRFIAGIGGGASGVLNRAIASDNFQGPAFVKAWSYTTTTLVMTLIFAPLIGSFVQSQFGWHANFILLSLLVSIAFILVFKYLPESNLNPDPNALRIKNILHNYKKFLMHKTFLLSLMCYIFAFSGLITFFQMSPFLFIETLGVSPQKYALVSMAVAASYLLGGILVGKLAPRHGIGKTMLMGIFLLIIGGITMLCDLENISVPIILLPSIIFIVGARLVIPNATASAMVDFTHNRGCASALIGSLQMMGTALVSFLVSIVNCTTQLPLGIAFTSLGVASIICFSCLLYVKRHPKVILAEAKSTVR